MNSTNESPDPRDALILSLCEKLYICSRLLTRASERLGWDTVEVKGLVAELRESIHASLQSQRDQK